MRGELPAAGSGFSLVAAVLSPTATTRLVSRFTTMADEAPASRATQPDVLSSLTEREREVFALLAQGLSNREIATELYISEHTIKIHVARVLSKLELRDRVQAVVLAYESGDWAPGRALTAAYMQKAFWDAAEYARNMISQMTSAVQS